MPKISETHWWPYNVLTVTSDLPGMHMINHDLWPTWHDDLVLVIEPRDGEVVGVKLTSDYNVVALVKILVPFNAISNDRSWKKVEKIVTMFRKSWCLFLETKLRLSFRPGPILAYSTVCMSGTVKFGKKGGKNYIKMWNVVISSFQRKGF